MKSQMKTIALSAMFSIIGLCLTISTASADSKTTHEIYMSDFSNLASEVGSKEKQLLTPDNKVKEFQACKSVTKNEYFELAVIFNDKLQQLIASFSYSKVNNSKNTQLSQVTK